VEKLRISRGEQQIGDIFHIPLGELLTGLPDVDDLPTQPIAVIPV